MSADAVTATCVAIPEKGDEELMEFSRVPRENNAMMEDKRSWKEAEEGSSVNGSGSVQSQSCLRRNLFMLLLSAGIVVGFVIGVLVRSARPGDDIVMWLGALGSLNSPLPNQSVFISPQMIVSVYLSCFLNVQSDHFVLFFNFCLSVFLSPARNFFVCNRAVDIVLTLTMVSSPGTISSRDTSTKVDTRNLQTVDIVADFIRNLFPSNIVRAAISQSQTKYKEVETLSVVNVSGVMTNVTDTVLVKSLGMTSTTNLLGLIIICAALGIAASQLGRKSEPMVAFFRAGASVIFKLFDWIKWSSPVGVASLIARALISIDDLAEGFTSMGLFLLATMVGGLVYQLVFLTGLYLLLIRRNPITFLLSLARPWLISVGPPSSLIVYPEIMEIAIHKYKVDPRVPGFVLPFCTTLNRDGSCCFIVTTCLFVAQFAGTELTASLCLLTGVGGLSLILSLVLQISPKVKRGRCTIGSEKKCQPAYQFVCLFECMFVWYFSLLSILSSLAIPSVPSASVVAVLLILGSLGIPPVNIGLILAVEWMTDRLRTTTNAVSHMLAVLVTWEFTKKHLQGKTKDEEQPILTDAVQSTSPKNNL
ncbi:excitatory amino acid transporter [Aplysia californica]|uniref:Amino acid transporter n=1 Tax=Aplysia californica TaxID=6500 RepID=A0ABM1VPM9_APLCA|nr:excitatory amino acid transporter [Aplysia californica]